MSLDIEMVRAQFPAFSEPKLRGQAFFENAGGTYANRFTIWRLHRFYRERKVQPYAAYEASAAGGAEMDEAQARIARILGVEPHEVSFGPSTSQNTYVLSQAFREYLNEGDAIVVTNQDHEANTGVWRRLAKSGIDVREWRMDAQGHLDPDALRPLLADGRVRLVTFPHCSNVLAEINDVRAICDIAKAAGAWSCVDGVSYAPHGLPDVGALGADIYMFSSYKTYGPHLGVMTIRAPVARQLPNQGHKFNGGTLTKRFTPAGPDHAQVAAAAGIADYIDALYEHHKTDANPDERRGDVVHGLIRDREISLMQPLLDWAAKRNTLRLLGPRTAAERAPTFAFATDRPGETVAAALAKHGIMAGGGDFYAPRPLEALGIDPSHGVLRLSFVHYTTEAEVARLIDALNQEL